MSVAVEHLVVRDAEVARVLGAIPDWWSRRARRAGLSPRWCDWRAALDEPPLALDTTHTGFERARPETIGDAYVGALAPAVRLREGRHYTPPRLAAALWREIDAVTGVRGGVVDPSCGAGALLAPYVRRRVRAAQDARATLDEIASSVAGTDVDPIGVWLFNALVA